MIPVTYFRNQPYPYYSDWKREPIPGWGVRPVMAGPRMVAVGGLGDAGVDQFVADIVNKSYDAKSSKLDVVGLQNVLNNIYGCKLEVDGVWGPKTAEAQRLAKSGVGCAPKKARIKVDISKFRTVDKAAATRAVPETAQTGYKAGTVPEPVTYPFKDEEKDKSVSTTTTASTTGAGKFPMKWALIAAGGVTVLGLAAFLMMRKEG